MSFQIEKLPRRAEKPQINIKRLSHGKNNNRKKDMDMDKHNAQILNTEN